MWTALVSFQLDLRELKTLCRNSLEFSGLLGDEKESAMAKWEKDWAAWVDDMNERAGSDWKEL